MPDPKKRTTLTARGIARLKAPATGQRLHKFDSIVPGFAVRVTDKGTKSFVVITRLHGKQKWVTLGRVGVLELADAREAAREALNKARAGEDPRPRPTTGTDMGSIVETFMERHAKRETRTWPETQRIFDLYVLPKWRDRPIASIGRLDVAELLDAIEDGKLRGADGKNRGGPVMANRTLAAVRKMFNWYATRDNAFVSPVVRGMARGKPVKRDRVLSDAEIRALWAVVDEFGTFGAIVKTLLLTAQRRGEVALMAWPEIDVDGVWTIDAERYKTSRTHHVPLSDAARVVIDAQPEYQHVDLVFTTNGRTPFSGWSKPKPTLDARMLEALHKEDAGGDPAKVQLPRWTLHDLRRTAKTLMQRAGVRPDISERVLGHVIPGVEGVYDRHGYLDEKRDAVERLAAEVRRITEPTPDNVVRLRSEV